MKILYFHQHFSTPNGSVGTRSYEFARFLVSRGHSVTVICGQYQSADTGLCGPFVRGKRTGSVEGISIVEYALPYSNSDGFLKRSTTFLKFSLKSLSQVLCQDYDLLFATSTPLTAAIPGIVMKVLKKRRFVFEVRDLWPELPRAMGVIKNPIVLKLLDWLEWLAYHAADRCIGLSPGICDGIVRRGIDKSRVHMVPNGCDLQIFQHGVESKSIFNDSRLDDKAMVAIFTGAHGIANGLDSALNAARCLKDLKRNDIFLVFVGDGREKARLVERARREGLDNCLFFGSVPKIELSKMMKACDVGLMLLQNVPAFYYGTSPNKFFDYISAGRPVLNNYPGWVADMIQDYQCGVVVRPDDPQDFARGLIELADNPEQRAQFSQNAAKLAQDRFSRQLLAAEFERILTMK